ncbi:uncharacterized protein LOC107217955 isoform X2 [Neodiprion lecontei]|uniref:Uncharacterized protein LOC107217955 isoform X2 n=1 Tax=Neodiprion lecontei TaxID=441921 RepID=A0A6J0BBU0_NEOLC|nr:uncharacterized protein LOC107217955 isoform X2 [Neodiprion lecontei]
MCKKMTWTIYIQSILLLCAICTVLGLRQCDQNNTGWEKVAGMRPESVDSSAILYEGINSQGITTTCFRKCRALNCTAFVIDLERAGCFSVKVSSQHFVPEPNVTFYHQICVKVPSNCKLERLWQVERTLGAILVDPSARWLPEIMTRAQCYESCIAAGRNCRSARYRTAEDLRIGDTQGRCALSTLDRGSRPQAYRASMYRDEYLQNQCHNLSKADYCSYSEFENATMLYSDLRLPGLDETQCEERCDASLDGFNCRGYTVHRSYNSITASNLVCLLHADDTIGAGPSSLIYVPDLIYKEREPCLDLRVRCTNESLTVELSTDDAFWGRLYVSGWGERCGVQGSGKNLTSLRLVLPHREDLTMGRTIKCGLSPVISVNSRNRSRTIAWATVVVQFNPIIQRLGDQAVRVGCSLDGNDDPPQPRNITVHSDVHFIDPNAGLPPIVSTVVNSSSEAPMVRMRILDESLSRDATVTQLGQKLILRIEIIPPDGPFDIFAGHLVASSAGGDSSYLLLDEMGCPTDTSTFPALVRDVTDNSSLVAKFTAFKFPNSQLVRFNVVVKFCTGRCKPAHCSNDEYSYGRRRREISTAPTNANVTEITPKTIPDKIPLQFSIFVHSPVVSPDPLLSRDSSAPDTILVAGGQSLDGLLCVDAGLALGLLIFWLIVQIMLTIGCLVAVKRYRRLARRAEEDRADILARHLYGIHGGNFEVARRVRWADHNSSSVS